MICFLAYDVRGVDWSSGTVVDLGANIGISTRYFLECLPCLDVVSIEPSRENCEMFAMNMALTAYRHRAKLLECAVGPIAGTGRLIDNTGRFDSFKVEFLDVKTIEDARLKSERCPNCFAISQSQSY